MKKEYLDFLYMEKHDAQDRLDQISSVKNFNGSEGSCHVETHRVEKDEAERLLDTLDRLITNYIDVCS